jgi:hypothetical protein
VETAIASGLPTNRPPGVKAKNAGVVALFVTFLSTKKQTPESSITSFLTQSAEYMLA